MRPQEDSRADLQGRQSATLRLPHRAQERMLERSATEEESYA